MKKGIIQKKLIPSFEEQENKLLEHYEGKYKEAQRIIIDLEKEIEELKSKGYHFEHSNHSIKRLALFNYLRCALKKKYLF